MSVLRILSISKIAFLKAHTFPLLPVKHIPRFVIVQSENSLSPLTFLAHLQFRFVSMEPLSYLELLSDFRIANSKFYSCHSKKIYSHMFPFFLHKRRIYYTTKLIFVELRFQFLYSTSYNKTAKLKLIKIIAPPT